MHSLRNQSLITPLTQASTAVTNLFRIRFCSLPKETLITAMQDLLPTPNASPHIPEKEKKEKPS